MTTVIKKDLKIIINRLNKLHLKIESPQIITTSIYTCSLELLNCNPSFFFITFTLMTIFADKNKSGTTTVPYQYEPKPTGIVLGWSPC